MSFQALSRSVRCSRLIARYAASTLTKFVHSQAAPTAQCHMNALSFVNRSVPQSKSLLTPLTRAFSSAASETVPVPSMGDSISEGTVVEWLKAPGDFVGTDEVVVVLETDKVSVDVRTPFSGVLEAQLAQVDENVSVGAPLFSVAKKDTGNTSAVVEYKENTAGSPESAGEDFQTIKVPSMGDSISEGTVVTILKQIDDYVHADEAVVVVETDKVSVDVNASVSGKLKKILAKIDDVVKVGSPLFIIDKAVSAPAKATASKATPVSAFAESTQVAPLSPSDPSKLVSTAPAAPPTPTKGRYNRNETRVKMSALKVRASQRLKDTQNSAAILSTFQECDLGNLIALRDELGPIFEKTHGLKLGILSSFVKASAQALRQIPSANAFVDMENKEIIYNEFVDINVAIASERGVVMPVIRNVEKLSVKDIETTLATLEQQTRDGTLALEDLAGGTFTISNNGVNGALLSTSMLAAPQSAVLGVHGVKMRPAVVAGKVVPRPMMFLSLTYDHRIIDGREGVTLLKTIAEAINDPRRLLLDM